MDQAIYKYAFKPEDSFIIGMPKGAKILAVQTQRDRPCIWAQVYKDAEIELRLFYLLGTGFPMGEAANATYVGTFQMLDGDLVFHLFDAGVAGR